MRSRQMLAPVTEACLRGYTRLHVHKENNVLFPAVEERLLD